MENASEVLESVEEEIKGLLGNKRLAAATRVQLKALQITLIYLREDHQKVATMWTWFRPMAWAMVIAAASIITLLFSGRVEFVVR